MYGVTRLKHMVSFPNSSRPVQNRDIAFYIIIQETFFSLSPAPVSDKASMSIPNPRL